MGRQLSLSGALAAFLVGFSTTWILGFGALFTLLFFIIAAGVLGKLSKRIRGREMETMQAKGGRRDAMQVFANGLFALIGALLYAHRQEPAYLVMFAASVAEAASDTFAGDVGVLSRRDPVSIITGRPMKRGLSGAVSPLGLASGMLGAILIALTAWALLLPPVWGSLKEAGVIAAAAFFGCLIDSVLGATVQAHYWDEEREMLTEHSHKNGCPCAWSENQVDRQRYGEPAQQCLLQHLGLLALGDSYLIILPALASPLFSLYVACRWRLVAQRPIF